MKLPAPFSKPLLCSTLLLGMIFSSSLQAAEPAYQQALKLYEQQSYEQAFKAFEQLVESDYSSIDYSLYYALSAQALNKTDEAITAYERILILQPGHTRSKLELGKLYFGMKEYTLSQSYFNLALDDRIPETVRINVKQYLTKIEQSSELSTVSGALIIGAGYDSNVNSAPYAASWFVPVFGADFTNTTDTVSSFYHQEMAVLNHHYDSTEKYGFAINNNLLAYSKFVPGESDYNILYLRYKPSLEFDYQNYRISTGLQLDTMQYGGEAYLQNYGLIASATRNLNPLTQASAHAKLLKKNYLKSSDDGRDANYLELGGKYQQMLDSKTAWNISLDLIRERKESGSLTDVSYDAILLAAGLSYQLQDDIRLGGEISYTQMNYVDNNPFFLNKRQDNNFKVALDASKVINKDYSLQLRAERIQNNSNQAAYEYNKNLLLMNLIKRF